MSERIDNDLAKIVIANTVEDETDFIPLISEEDEDTIMSAEVPDTLPILPLRNTVLFPGVILPITVGRKQSMKLIRDIYKKSKILGTVTQKHPDNESPAFSDLYSIGTVAQILRILEMPDGSTSVIIQGKRRIKLVEQMSESPYLVAKVKQLTDKKPPKKDTEFEAIVGSLKDLSLRIIKLSTNIPPEASFALKNIESYTFLINFISSNSDIKLQAKQNLLEESDLKKRGISLLEHLLREVQMLELKSDIQAKVKVGIDQQQREFLLHQQMKTIQDELGGNPLDQEIEELKKKAAEIKWSKEVANVFEKEVEKMHRLNPATGEYSVQLNYLQTLLDLPWNTFTKDNFNLQRRLWKVN